MIFAPPHSKRLEALGLLVAVTVIVGMPFWFARARVNTYFSNDDMMNLYSYWSKSWQELLIANVKYYSPFYRPMGGLFYRCMFAVFGLDSVPFRAACFVIMAINLGLLYASGRALSGSREIGLLTALFGSYHARFVDLYYNTGTIYDLLCFSFYMSAFLIYTSARSQARAVPAHKIVLIVLLFICALNAKEMAITLPATLFLYELIYHRPKLIFTSVLRWCWKDLRMVWILAALAVPFVYGKLSPDSVFSHHGDYLLHVSLKIYLTAYARYLDRMFYLQSGWFTNTRLLILLASMVSVSIVSRRKELLFSSVFVLFSVVPVIFIEVRGSIFVLYIPFFGWVLYAATLLIWVRDGAGTFRRRVLPNVFRPAMLAGVTFAATAILLFAVHNAHTGPVTVDTVIQSTVQQIHQIIPALPANSSVLFMDDPFSTDEWTPLFLIRLSYGHDTIRVDRIKMMPQRPSLSEIKEYSVVLTYRDNRFIRIDPAGLT